MGHLIYSLKTISQDLRYISEQSLEFLSLDYGGLSLFIKLVCRKHPLTL